MCTYARRGLSLFYPGFKFSFLEFLVMLMYNNKTSLKPAKENEI